MFERCMFLLVNKTIVVIMLIVGLTSQVILGLPNIPDGTQISEDELAKKADEFLAQWDKKDMPGCSVGAVKEGKLIYKRAFGMANLDYDVPNTDTTLFNLASASKPFTAMSIALLAQQGKLSLDDDIRKYVPEIPKYDETVTIRHLIHHTSGIRDYLALIFLGGLGADNAYSPQAVLNILARQKNLNFEPGARYQYSNSGYFLMSLIVERASGKSLRVFAEENIFKPLGMKNTMYFDNRFEIVKNRSVGYRIAPDKKISSRSSLFDLVGSGGILTTVEDLSLWDRNFYEPKIGGKELIGLLTAPGTLNSGEKTGYGFGLFLSKYRGLRVFKHSGNMVGFRAQTITFPEQKFSAIALCNNMAILPSRIVEKLADVYLDGQLETAAPRQKTIAENLPPAVPLPATEAERYAGVYANHESGAVFRLNLKDGKLFSSGLLKNETPIMAIADNRFLVVADTDKYELTPVFNQSGKISEIKLTVNGGKPDVYVPVKPPLDAPPQLAEYAGIYYSDELDADYKISLKDNKLLIQIGENLDASLIAAYADYFSFANGQFRLAFERDEKGKVKGFVFDSAEVKGIAFQRR